MLPTDVYQGRRPFEPERKRTRLTFARMSSRLQILVDWIGCVVNRLRFLLVLLEFRQKVDAHVRIRLILIVNSDQIPRDEWCSMRDHRNAVLTHLQAYIVTESVLRLTA